MTKSSMPSIETMPAPTVCPKSVGVVSTLLDHSRHLFNLGREPQIA
jgi:hypothetical protein